MNPVPEDAKAVLDFWFGSSDDPACGEPRRQWFRKDAGFDAAIRQRFEPQVRAAIDGAFDHWLDAAQPTLALVVLLDQFPRNIWRGTARAFAGDAKALAAAAHAVDRGYDREVLPVQRWFFYLPFEHAEDIAAQRRSVALHEGLRDHAPSAEAIDYAWRHLRIIERFGRFPHRNAQLGRASTQEELAFLRLPGSGF